MNLLIIRHGLPLRVENADGPADPELSPDGHEQARRVADYLADESIDAIYSSPMRRAHQTAMPTAERFGLDITIDPRIAENDQGASEYIPVEELKAEGDARLRQAWTIDDWPDHYEPMDVFRGRVLEGMESIVANHAGQNVAVFCHGGVIGVYTTKILDKDPNQVGFFYPYYTSINRIAASRRGDRTILTLNEIGHLRNTGLPTGQL